MKAETIGETEDLITEDAVANSAAKYVPASSVLMVMRSGILRHTFPVAINDRTVTLNQDLLALTPYDGIAAAFPGSLSQPGYENGSHRLRERRHYCQ
jgi:type I restriction enzyme S subunit